MTKRWIEIRQQVLERDDKLCQNCYNKGENVHHVIPRRLHGRDVLENLIVLCDKCHTLLELRKPISRYYTIEKSFNGIVIFISKINKFGNKKKYITIPRDYWEDIEPLRNKKRVKVTIENI